MQYSNIFTVLAGAALTVASPLPQLNPRGSSGVFPSVTEITWCLNPWHFTDCWSAQGHADVASGTAATLYPAFSLHNGRGDAFRHCYWNARMTIDLGAQTAKTIADNHEAGSDGPANENAMDLANNSYGRSVGANAAGATNDEKFDAANAACQAAAASGALVTLE